MATAPTLFWYQLTVGTYAPEYYHQLDTSVRQLCSENSITRPTANWYNSVTGTLVSTWISQIDTAVRALCVILSVTPPSELPTNLTYGQFFPKYNSDLDVCVRALCAGAGGVPINVTPPDFTGTLTAGQLLTYVPGVWTGATTITNQWFSNGVAIGGAIGSTLDSTGYGGTLISVGETASNTSGSAAATSSLKYLFVNEAARALVARISVTPPDYWKAAYDGVYSISGFPTALAKLDQFLMLSGVDSQAAVLDWCANRSAIASGAMTFNPSVGANTDGVTGFIDSGVLNSGGTHLTQNDASLGCYVQNGLGATDYKNIIGIASATDHFRMDPNGTGATSSRLNGASTNAFTNNGTTGLFVAVRTGASALETFQNSVSLGTAATASIAPLAADILYFKNNATFAAGVIVSSVFFGASLNTIDQTALKTGIETLATQSTPRNFLFVFCGQSNGRALFFDSATVGAGSGDNSVGSNSMARVLIPELQGYLNTQFNDGRPNMVTVLDTCVGGSALSQPYGTAGNWWWLPTANAGAGGPGGYATADRTAVANAKATLAAQGHTFDYIVRVWVQGESDAESSSSSATYENSWNGAAHNTGLQKYFRDGDGITTPIIISPIGRYAPPNPGFDSNLLQIRTAETSMIADGSSIYLSSETADLVRTTDWHNVPFGISIYGCDRLSHFLAKAIASVVGCTTVSWRGPEISAATRVDDTHTTATVIYPTGCAGTDFTPISGIDGFLIKSSGVIATISAAVHTNSGLITFTHSSVPAATGTLQYMPDRGPVDRTNMVYDNDNSIPLGMPMRLSAILTIS